MGGKGSVSVFSSRTKSGAAGLSAGGRLGVGQNLGFVGRAFVDEGFEGVEGVLAMAAAHPPLASAQLLRAHPEGGGARGAAGQDHGTAGAGCSPSRRTQPSWVAPTRRAM